MRTGTAMATVVFIDIVDSTEHRSRMGEAAADSLFRAHEDLLRQTVDDHGGRVLKSGGDGVMAVFDAASDAVMCSIGVQRAVRRASPEIGVRIGIAAGDVSWEGDDCFGLPVIVAKRLESAADPGTVSVSAVVQMMAGNRASVIYRPLDPLRLKGIDDPVAAFAVEAAFEAEAEVADSGQAAWPFPTTLHTSERSFVGRDAELALLRTAWLRTTEGGSEFVLIGGDAGGGKTRLATELARECHRDGAVVLHGLNDSELALPYQPWVMTLEQLIAMLPSASIDACRDDLAVLRLLHPRIDRQIPGLPATEQLDPETQRHNLLQGVASILREVTALAPTVLIIDDLHWAGPQSLDVLRYLARTAPVSGLLVLVTFRDTDDEVSGALGATLADLRRLDRASRLKLGGLDASAIEKMLAEHREGKSSDLGDLAAEITARTGGNPFFVSELCLHLGDQTTEVPESVVEVVAARVNRLPLDARRAAELLAVAANRVALPVLGDALALGDAALGTAVSELVGSGLATEGADTTPTYQYTHALLRDAVMTSLGASEKLHLHRALAEAIESVYEADRRSVLPQLARHYAAAVVAVGPGKAIYYGRRAAAQARQTAAYEEGVSVVRTVLGAVPDIGPDRLELAVDLIDLLQRSGHPVESATIGLAEFRSAAEQGEVRLMAELALQSERVGNLAGGGGPAVEAMLDAVLATDVDERTRLRLRAALAREKWMTGRDDAVEHVEVVLADARRFGDDAALALALEASIFPGSEHPDVLDRTMELEALTIKLGDPWSAMWATGNRVRILIKLGRLDEAAVAAAHHREIASRYRFFLFQFMAEMFDGILAMVHGRFDDADAAAERADELGLSDDDMADSGIYGMLMFTIRREQGRLEEMRPVLSILSRASETPGVWSPGLALASAELGMMDDARTAFDLATAPGVANIPVDSIWPTTIGFLAETAILLEDESVAADLLELLDRLAGQGIMAGFTTTLGPADRLRAALSELIGRPSDADAHIEAAREFARRSGGAAWMARVEHTQAWICGRRGDRPGYDDHFARACAIAEPIGMRSITDHPPGTASDAVPVETTSVLPDGLSPRESDVLAHMSRGSSNKEIAEALLISPNTAANHVRSILQKTGCANRAEAAAYAVRNGID